MPAPEQKNGVLFFTSMPNLEELCCLVVAVPSSEKNKENVNAFQPQVIKCREIIFTEPDVLASPLLGARKKFQIIMQVDVYNSGRLQARLERMNMQCLDPKAVTAAEFQACLQYTLNARIAPLWNKVGAYLIQGREFMTSLQKMNAVSLCVTVNKSELFLKLTAVVVKSPPVGLSDLDICGPVVSTFMDGQKSSENMIDEYSIGNKWCYILPSMKRGQIVNIVREIPTNSPFSSYKAMKKYWKNMYGYRLPDTEDGLLYYQIYFKPIGSSLFTYPECCVRMRELLLFNCPNTDVVLQQFLADFQAKMPSICGKKVTIQSKALYAVTKLNNTNADVDSCHKANLTENNTTNIKSQYRVVHNSTDKPATPWKPNYSHTNSDKNSMLCSQGRASLPLPQKENSRSEVISQSNVSEYFSENLQSNVTKVSPDEVKATRIIPMFKRKNTKPVRIVVEPQIKKAAMVPIFGKTHQVVIPHTESNEDIISENETATRSLNTPREKALVPSFASKVNALAVSAGYSQKKRQIQEQTRKALPKISHVSHVTVNPNKHLVHKMNPGDSTPDIQKRKIEEDRIEAIKKPRMKPKVQENIDVKQMALTNQLGKVNTQTLMAWLKAKGVPCKNKDKKPVLVDRVLTVLQIERAEQ